MIFGMGGLGYAGDAPTNQMIQDFNSWVALTDSDIGGTKEYPFLNNPTWGTLYRTMRSYALYRAPDGQQIMISTTGPDFQNWAKIPTAAAAFKSYYGWDGTTPRPAAATAASVTNTATVTAAATQAATAATQAATAAGATPAQAASAGQQAAATVQAAVAPVASTGGYDFTTLVSSDMAQTPAVGTGGFMAQFMALPTWAKIAAGLLAARIIIK